MPNETARAGDEGHPTLARPPIVEALVDVRVKRSASARVEMLRTAHPLIAARFPAAEDVREMSALIRFGGEKPLAQASQHPPSGLRFTSSDKTEVVQFRLDGFTYNRLPPYPGWHVMKEAAINLWRIYVSIARPESVGRIGLRFINRISLGSDPAALDDYLLALPRLPPGWPNEVLAYQSRVTLFDARSDCSVHVTQAAEKTADTAMPRWILDIDAYRETAREPNKWAEIGPLLDSLRELKNRIFFNALTPLALESLR